MQFACSMDISYNSPDDVSVELIKDGGVLRSLDGMTRIVQIAGGTVVWVDRIHIFPTA